MLALVWLMMMMMMEMEMEMKNDAAPAEIHVSARSGEAALLTSNLSEARMDRKHDVRWTHHQLVLSLKNNVTMCHHGRCKLQIDGSLSFSQVQPTDSGNYSLEVFNNAGVRVLRRDFLLTVNGTSDTSETSCVRLVSGFSCFLLLLVISTFFILRKRRGQRTRTEGLMEENVYMVMHGHHGNEGKGDEEKQDTYAPCEPAVSIETHQLSEDESDIYV